MKCRTMECRGRWNIAEDETLDDETSDDEMLDGEVATYKCLVNKWHTWYLHGHPLFTPQAHLLIFIKKVKIHAKYIEKYSNLYVYATNLHKKLVILLKN